MYNYNYSQMIQSYSLSKESDIQARRRNGTRFLILAAFQFSHADLIRQFLRWWNQMLFFVLDGCGSRLQCRLWWRGVCPCWWGRVAAVSRERWLVLRPTSERKGGIPAYSLLYSGIHAHKTHSVHKSCTTWPSVHLCVLVEHLISKPWVFLVKNNYFLKEFTD